MTSDAEPAAPRLAEPPSFDTSRAHPARVYDYLLGGKDNYQADREAGDQVIAAMPSVPAGARANRAFLRRAVGYLVAEAGIRQFLDIGTGLPTADNTHEVAQSLAPESRVVYVDNDPIVLAHARALLTSCPAGATAYIDADARDTATIVREAGRTLDFTKPVAVMMLLLLHFIPDADEPGKIVRELLAPLAPGSYLVVTAAASDIQTEQLTGVATRYNSQVTTGFTARSREQIARYFDGLELIEPGIVPVADWRARNDGAVIPAYAGVGRTT